MPDKNGVTQREHLEHIQKQLGRRPKDLEPPCEFPELLNHVWVAFCVLSGRRTSGISGPNPITFSDIESWSRLTEANVSPKELDVLLRLDQTYMKVANDRP